MAFAKAFKKFFGLFYLFEVFDAWEVQWCEKIICVSSISPPTKNQHKNPILVHCEKLNSFLNGKVTRPWLFLTKLYSWLCFIYKNCREFPLSTYYWFFLTCLNFGMVRFGKCTIKRGFLWNLFSSSDDNLRTEFLQVQGNSIRCSGVDKHTC